MRPFKGLLLAFALLFSSFCSADEGYNLYKVGNDYYLSQNPDMVIIHGEVIVPIALKKHVYIKLTWDGTSWKTQKLSEAQWVSGNYASMPKINDHLMYGDFDGDGQIDILIRGDNYNDNSFVLSKIGAATRVTVLDANVTGVDTSMSNTQLVLKDFDGDGKTDIFDGKSILYGSETNVLETRNNTSFFTREFERNTVVGNTKFSSHVDSTGAFNIDLPIQLPSAPAGFIPPVSLSYSSHYSPNGLGILGFGWSLKATKVIHRCSKNSAQDRVAYSGTIQFTESDRLCLNGQRLQVNGNNLADDATYWAAGQTYHLELDDLSTITALSNTGSNFFEMVDKTGNQYEFGWPETVIANDKSKVQGWKLTSITDIFGNKIRYHYDDSDLAEQRLHAIEYSGQGNSFAARVTFKYRTAADHRIHHRSNTDTKAKNSKLLDQVVVTLDNELFRRYDLRYEFRSQKNLTSAYLAGLQECAALGNHSKCLQPVTFDWDKKVLQQTLVNDGVVLTDTARSLITPNTVFVDLTGDGKVEAIDSLGIKEGVSGALFKFQLDYDKPRFHIIDFDADGVNDVLYNNNPIKDGYWRLVRFENGRFKEQHSGLPYSKNKSAYVVADVNGDGIQDFVFTGEHGDARYYLNQPGIGGGSFNHTFNFKFGRSEGRILTALGDINGDGKTEIAFQTFGVTKANATKLIYSQANGYSAEPIHDASAFFRASATCRNGGTLQTNNGVLQCYRGSGSNLGRPDFVCPEGYNRSGEYCSEKVIKTTEAYISAVRSCKEGEFHPYKHDGCYRGQTRVSNYTYSCYFDNAYQNKFSIPRGENCFRKEFTLDKVVFPAGDINGDGLADLYRKVDTGKFKFRLEYGLFRGGREFAWYETGLFVDEDSKIESQDLDGDGRSDLVLVNQGENNHLNVYLARSALKDGQLIADKMVFYPIYAHNSNDIGGAQVVDADGDGIAEIFTISKKTPLKVKRYSLTKYGSNRLTDICSRWNPITNRCDYGVNTKVEYANYLDDTVIVGKSNIEPGYPLVKQKHGYFVKAVTKDTPDSGTPNITLTYQYKNGLVDRAGRGFLGFGEMTTTNSKFGSVSQKAFSQSFPYIGLVTAESTHLGGQLVSQITAEPTQKNTAQGGVFRYLNKVTEQKWDLKGIELPTTWQVYQYDTWGNTERHLSFVKSPGEAVGDNDNTNKRKFFNNDNDRRFGRPYKTEVNIYRRIGDRGRYRGYTDDFFYYPNGAVKQKISQKAARTKIGGQHYSLNLTMDYQYDAFGNLIQESQTGLADASGNQQTRTSKSQFSSNGRLLKWTENALRHRNAYTYDGLDADSSRGVISSTEVTDTNGLKASTSVNAFGEIKSTRGADGVVTTIERGVCGSCESVPAYSWVASKAPGQPSSKLYYDKFGNQVGEGKGHQDGSLSVSHLELDWRGLVVKSYRPGEGSSNRSYFTHTAYDKLGRPERKVDHNQGSTPTTAYVYNGLTTEVTEPNGAIHRKTLDKHGNTVLVVDPYGTQTRFTYQLNDKVSTVIQDGNVNTRIEHRYSAWDKKTQTRSPGKGRELYTHNAFGELISSLNGANEWSYYSYDILGRQRERRNDDGINCWNYDTGAYGKGQLSQEYVIHNGATCGGVTSADYARIYTYNGKGQLANSNYQVKGQGSYLVSQTYQPDSGLIDLLTLPSTTQGVGSVKVKVKYNYTNGYLSQISDGNGKPYQTIQNRDIWGNVILEQLGNGVSHSRVYGQDNGQLDSLGYRGSLDLFASRYEYDVSGNMSSREFDFGIANTARYYSQGFSYDQLNRLTCFEDKTTGASLGYFAYDKFGNISANAANAPAYSSGCAAAPSGNQASLNDTALIYSASYPYRLDSVDGKAVRYGGSGNIREYRSSKLTYSAADKVLTIDSWNAGKKDSTNYSYGPNGDRYRKAVSRYVDGQLENSSTFYISSVYERHQRAAGAGKSALTEEKYFIGDVIITKRSNQAHSVFYQLKDEQGSTLMLTDDKGKEVNRYYYTPFGEQRDVSLSPLPSSMLQPTRYGYTGHEHVAGLDIINMGGRIYSHSLRRFLQADPLVAHPMFSQSFNPYQYVYNNPLVNVDPSGYAVPLAVYGVYAGLVALATAPIAEQAINNTRRVSLSTNTSHLNDAVNAYVSDPRVWALGGYGIAVKALADTIGINTESNATDEINSSTSLEQQTAISNGVYDGRSAEGPQSGSYEHIPGEVAPLGNVYNESEKNGDGRFYGVLTEAPISGETRSSHRRTANRALLKALEGDRSFSQDLSNELDEDVIEHMKSGKSGLKNPPGTEWHHSKGNSSVMQLLRREVHRDKNLQDSLHPDGSGGFSEHFNKN